MDPKRKQLLASTGQSLEKISRFLGINLSSYMGRLYSLALMVLFSFLSQISWDDICTVYYRCEKHVIRKFMVMLQHFLFTLLILTTVGTSIFRPKQFAFPRQELSVIDSILESYGAQFSNKDIFLAKYLQDIVTSILALLAVIKYTYNVDIDNPFQLIWFSLRSCYPRICFLIMDGLFTHYVTDIYLRFRELNKIAIRHSPERRLISYIDFITADSKIFNKHTVVTKIRSMQHIHHGLYSLATKVNNNFGLQLLIASAISLNTIILYMHNTYYNLKTNIGNIEKIILEIIIIFLYVLRCLYVSYVCQRSRNESRQMAKILHDVFLKHKSLRSEVVHFSLQLVHEDLVFTAFGLYEINIPLMCSFAAAVVTYFVMVVQLETTKFASTNNTDTI